MKVPQLRAELAIRGCDTSGAKANLRKRLEDALLNSAPNTVIPLTHVSTVTAAELRTLLKARGLDTSGRKLILRARLEEALLEDIARAIEKSSSTPANPPGFGKFFLWGEEMDWEDMRKQGLLEDEWCRDVTVVNGEFNHGVKCIPFNDGSSE
jgi:hypothetical protein